MFESNSEKPNLFAYFGHHKAASSWIEAIIVNVCADMGIKHGLVDRPSLYNHIYPELIGSINTIRGPRNRVSIKDLSHFVEEFNIEFLSYTNADFKYVEKLNNVSYRGFHVIRDPRDIVVSAYFSHLKSHPTDVWPELMGHREELQALSKDEGLMLEIDCRKKDFENINHWNYEMPNIYELKMEEMIDNPYKLFLNIFDFLGIINESDLNVINRCSYFLNMMIRRAFSLHAPMKEIPAERLLGIVHKNRFERAARGRKQGQEDKSSHYRKGKAGDWQNHFNENHKKYFKDKYGDLLIELDYEIDNNW
jgi:hypothetical protein